MPPKQIAGAKRGRPAKAANNSASKRASTSNTVSSADPFASSDADSEDRNRDDHVEVLSSEEETPKQRRSAVSKAKPKAKASGRRAADGSDEEMDTDRNTSTSRSRSRARPETIDDDEEPPEKTIPPGLLARLLQETFEKDGTRMTGDAARATAKYVDVFVREAIARCMHEKDSSFLEVEDLEKISPQLLMDF